MITCKTVTALHTDASEGVLGWWRRVLYRVHMSFCPNCQVYARGLEQTAATLRATRSPAPESSREQAMAALRARRRPPASSE